MNNGNSRDSKLKDMFGRLKKPFGKKSSDIGEIKGPTDVKHEVHVKLNKSTGQLEGIPDSWTAVIERLLGYTNENDVKISDH